MAENDKRAESLVALLQLEKEARCSPSLKAFSFVIVNETIRILPYMQAVSWQRYPSGEMDVLSVSGVSRLEENAPFMRWQKALIKYLAKNKESEVCAVGPDDVKRKASKEWLDWAAPFGLWVPFSHPITSKPIGGLWLVREKEWDEREIAIAKMLGDVYSAAMALHQSRPKRTFSIFVKGFFLSIFLTLAVSFSFLFPVRLSVLAPAEVVASDPVFVSSPHNGVIEDFFVSPGDTVKEGQLLFSLDETTLRNQYNVAQKSLDIARAEYHQAAQDAFRSRESKANLNLLKAQAEKVQAEITYTKDLLERIKVKSPRDGIVIFNDKNEWLGKPARVGEKILTVAEPNESELRIDLPVEDAIIFSKDVNIRFFLNITPENPLEVILRTSSFEPELSPEQILVYKIKANFAGNIKKLPRIGLRGTAKIYGEKVTLFYYLMRRPLSALRQMFGI